MRENERDGLKYKGDRKIRSELLITKMTDKAIEKQ